MNENVGKLKIILNESENVITSCIMQLSLLVEIRCYNFEQDLMPIIGIYKQGTMIENWP
jgi:hypothetical protein